MEDPQRAEQWVASLPAGPFRENAIASYVDAASNWAPDLAAEQALTLADGSVRTQKVEMCLKRWMEVDPVSAQQWLPKANLPPNLKNRYRHM